MHIVQYIGAHVAILFILVYIFISLRRLMLFF